MAVEPFFITDMATLKGTLRLSGVPDGVDAASLIDNATKDARMSFVRRLTQERMDTIKSYPSVEAPTNDEENLRMTAELAESKLVRLYLMHTMPVLFQDSAELDEQAWNEEGLFRGTSPAGLTEEKGQLQNEIEALMDFLSGEREAGDVSQIRISVIGPSEPPPRPGESVWGGMGWF